MDTVTLTSIEFDTINRAQKSAQITIYALIQRIETLEVEKARAEAQDRKTAATQ